MLRASILFFLLGLAAIFSGITNAPGIPFETARVVFFTSTGIAILTFLIALIWRQEFKESFAARPAQFPRPTPDPRRPEDRAL